MGCCLMQKPCQVSGFELDVRGQSAAALQRLLGGMVKKLRPDEHGRDAEGVSGLQIVRQIFEHGRAAICAIAIVEKSSG
jgi:hypothetical protein